MTPEKIERLVASLEKKNPNAIAFDRVTFGELLAVAKIALDEESAAEGVESAHSTMAQFMEKNDG